MYLVEKHVLQLATPVTERVYDRIMKCVACNLLAPRRMEDIFVLSPCILIVSDRLLLTLGSCSTK